MPAMNAGRGQGFQPVPLVDSEEGDLSQSGRYEDPTTASAQRTMNSGRSANMPLQGSYRDEEEGVTQLYDSGYYYSAQSGGTETRPGERPSTNSSQNNDSRDSRGYGTGGMSDVDADECSTSYKGARAVALASDQGSMPNYKPVVFRLWFLGALVVVLVTALAMMELAVHKLPDGTKSAKPVEVMKNSTELRARAMQQRDVVSVSSIPDATTSIGLKPSSRYPTGGSLAPIATPTRESGPTTCTATLIIEEWATPEIPDAVTTTVDVVTVTEGAEDEDDDATTSSVKDTQPTAQTSLETPTDRCDVTVTKTVTYSPEFTIAPPDYITVGRNTVTVRNGGGGGGSSSGGDDDHGDDVNGNNGPVGGDPVDKATKTTSSACDLKTVTVTDKADAVVATKTVTVDVIQIVGGGVAKRTISPLAAREEEEAMLEARACEAGGTVTVTEHIAMPKTVVVTVSRTITSYAISRTTRTTLDKGSKTSTATTAISSSEDKPTESPDAVINSGDNVRTITSLISPTPGSDSTDPVQVEILVVTPAQNTTTEEPERVHLTSMLTTITTTLKDREGTPTHTTTMRVFAMPTTTTLTNGRGRPTETREYYIYNLPLTTTYLDAEGEPSTVMTYYAITSATTVAGDGGKAETTSTTVQTKTVTTTTMRNEAGEPTRTMAVLVFAKVPSPASKKKQDPSDDGDDDGDGDADTVLHVYSISQFQYFAGLMLPTIIATALTIPFRILDHVVRLYHPFHVLAAASSAAAGRRGAPAARSLCCPTTGPRALLARMHPVLLATGTLVVMSALLVPLGAETMRVILQGDECRAGQGNAHNCAITVGVFPVPARVAVGALGALAVVVAVVALALRRYRTGVGARAWTLAEMAALANNPEMRAVLGRIPRRRPGEGRVDRREVLAALDSHAYVLGFWHEGPTLRYGVVPVDHPAGVSVVSMMDPDKPPAPVGRTPSWGSSGDARPYVLTIWARALALFVLVGLLAIIAVYNAMDHPTSMSRFLDSETVGLRIFITLVGISITLFWTSYFYSIAFISPYRMIHRDRNRLRSAIHASLSTNSFSGLFRALRPSSRDLYLAAVAFVAILSEFLPALLANMPYKVIQTWLAHSVCTWMTVGIVGLMVVLIVASFFLDWPHLPLDPGTVVGAMYYVSELSGETTETRPSTDPGV